MVYLKMKILLQDVSLYPHFQKSVQRPIYFFQKRMKNFGTHFSEN